MASAWNPIHRYHLCSTDGRTPRAGSKEQVLFPLRRSSGRPVFRRRRRPGLLRLPITRITPALQHPAKCSSEDEGTGRRLPPPQAPGLCVSLRGQTARWGRRSVIPTPLTLGLFDVVSVRRAVGRRTARTHSWASPRCARVLPRTADVPILGTSGRRHRGPTPSWTSCSGGLGVMTVIGGCAMGWLSARRHTPAPCPRPPSAGP